MASPAQDVSFSFTLSAATESHAANSTQWYEWIIVDNSVALAVGNEIYVCVDGGTATNQGAHCEVVLPGQTKVFANGQPMPQANETYAGAWNAGTTSFASGKMDTGGSNPPSVPTEASAQRNQSMASNWTAQKGYQDTNGTPTICSVISTAGTQNVTVTFQ